MFMTTSNRVVAKVENQPDQLKRSLKRSKPELRPWKQRKKLTIAPACSVRPTDRRRYWTTVAGC
jgi:hypothetical protein